MNTPKKMINIDNTLSHLREHQEYPATKEELVRTCNELSDFSADDKKWFEDTLPKGTYHSAKEVMQAIGLGNAQATGSVLGSKIEDF